jgi:hypothetical protein
MQGRDYVGRFVFRQCAAAAGTARSATDHILIQELLTAAGDGVRIQTEKIAEQDIAAMAHPDGLQSGKQSPLLFVQQTLEQEDCGLEFVGRQLERGSLDSQGNGLSAAARQ